MREKIIEIANEVGIIDIGFCDFSAIKQGLIDCFAKKRIPNNAKTIILFLFPYKVIDERPDKISRYAAVPDYHTVCGKYLEKIKEKLEKSFKEEKFEAFIDNSPIPEVYAASRAGLGVMGENHLLINEKWGSFCFIGEIVTTMHIKTQNEQSECSLCGRCKSVCPVCLKKEECLSALSQQKKDLTEKQEQLLKENNIIWGCDACQEGCPLNQNSQKTYIKEFIDGYKNEYKIGDDISFRAFEWRGEKIIKRNALLFEEKF